MIRLFSDTATDFSTNGIGPLPSAASCFVTEERNGVFELEMVYPVDGKRFSEIHNRSIIVCKPNPYDDSQAFRVYAISKPINGLVTISASHISYDLNGIPVDPFTAEHVLSAMTMISQNAVIKCPFTFWTDKDTSGTLSFTTPMSIRSLLGGVEGSILDVYGGEYKFDNYQVRLYANRGSDKGVLISYGKNLTDIEQEENCSNVYTGIQPYYYTDQNGLHQLPEKVVNVDGNFNFQNIAPLDMTYDFDDAEEYPGDDALRELAKSYIKKNDIGTPKVSIDISFLQLSQSKEYETIEILENIQLCDTVTVRFKKMGIDAKAKCVSYKYNVLTNKYEELTLGEAKSNLATAISDQNQASKDSLSETKSFLQLAVDEATKQITGGLGGYVVIRSSTGGKEPDEILIMDTPDILTAKKIWRWNRGGLGFSSNGYNGPFTTAITQDGGIVADFITVGSLTASIIKSGIIQNLTKTTTYDLNQGTIRMGATTNDNIYIQKGSITMYKEQSDGSVIPSGIIYCGADGTFFGGRSQDTFYGYISNSTPTQNDYYGMRVTNGGFVNFNTTSIEINTSDGHRGLQVGQYISARGINCWEDSFHRYLQVGGGEGPGWLRVTGEFSVNGTGAKDAAVPTSYGTLLLTSTESPEPCFHDWGGGVCDENGECLLILDERFLAVTESSQRRRWMLTDTNGKGHLWAEDISSGALVHGAPGQTFDWVCFAAQRGVGGLYAEQQDAVDIFVPTEPNRLLEDSQYEESRATSLLADTLMNDLVYQEELEYVALENLLLEV